MGAPRVSRGLVHTSVVVLNISMNVTQLQQPPPHSSPPRSESEAEDITPDVCVLPMAWESLCLDTYHSSGR